MTSAFRWLMISVIITACGTTSVDRIAAGDIEAGRATFAASCVECHGAEALGSDQGPPLVDSIYGPGHHSDEAFLVAVRRGVPAHHWTFGPMPAVDGLTDADVANIVAYVRSLQRAAGIE